MNQDRKSELIHEIGTFILSNPPTEGQQWEKLALVVAFEEGAQGIYGFYYDAAGDGEPASVNDFVIVEKAAELRRAMNEPGKDYWHCCLIQLVRATQRFVMTFEYNDPNRWHINAKTLQSVRHAIRPPDDL